MSQNALLERKPALPGEQIEMEAPASETVVAARTHAQREHLSLVEWHGTALTVHTTAAPAPKPLRRRSVGLFDAGVIVLMVSSAGAALFSLLHLG